jgi:hypothetical protein
MVSQSGSHQEWPHENARQVIVAMQIAGCFSPRNDNGIEPKSVF